MRRIQTVSGEISSEEITGALVHEHVLASAPGIPENYPQLMGPNFMQRAAAALQELKDNGINTIVDASTYDLGRDPKRLRELSIQTGVNIICTTGFFFSLDNSFGNFSEDLISQIYIDDLMLGMAGTDIRAGIIKAVMDRECDTKGRVLQHHAAANASVETGCPIFLHTAADLETGRYQIPLLLEAGARPEKIRLDHFLDTTNMEYISWLYDQGVWLGADRLPRIRFEREHFVSTNARLKTVKAMIDAGMADRMLFSHDAGAVSALWDTVDAQTLRFVHDEVIPDGWLFILKHAFPALIEMGVEPTVLHQILFENPKRFFGQT